MANPNKAMKTIILSMLFINTVESMITQTLGPTDVVARQNSTVHFECGFRGKGRTTVIWFRSSIGNVISEDRRILPNSRPASGSFSIIANPRQGRYDLMITDVQVEDSDEYNCGYIRNGQIIAESALLTVISPPSYGYPLCTQSKDNPVVGGTVELLCRSDGGNPPANLTWFTGNQSLTPPRTKYNVLVLEAVEEDVGTQFTCVAESIAIGFPTSCNITPIIYEPAVAIRPDLAYVNVGDSVTFQCQRSDLPSETRFVWIFNDYNINSATTYFGKFALSEDSRTLEIRQISLIDDGARIKCRVQIYRGFFKSAIARITVKPLTTTTRSPTRGDPSTKTLNTFTDNKRAFPPVSRPHYPSPNPTEQKIDFASPQTTPRNNLPEEESMNFVVAATASGTVLFISMVIVFLAITFIVCYSKRNDRAKGTSYQTHSSCKKEVKSQKTVLDNDLDSTAPTVKHMPLPISYSSAFYQSYSESLQGTAPVTGALQTTSATVPDYQFAIPPANMKDENENEGSDSVAEDYSTVNSHVTDNGGYDAIDRQGTGVGACGLYDYADLKDIDVKQPPEYPHSRPTVKSNAVLRSAKSESCLIEKTNSGNKMQTPLATTDISQHNCIYEAIDGVETSDAQYTPLKSSSQFSKSFDYLSRGSGNYSKPTKENISCNINQNSLPTDTNNLDVNRRPEIAKKPVIFSTNRALLQRNSHPRSGEVHRSSDVDEGEYQEALNVLKEERKDGYEVPDAHLSRASESSSLRDENNYELVNSKQATKSTFTSKSFPKVKKQRNTSSASSILGKIEGVILARKGDRNTNTNAKVVNEYEDLHKSSVSTAEYQDLCSSQKGRRLDIISIPSINKTAADRKESAHQYEVPNVALTKTESYIEVLE